MEMDVKCPKTWHFLCGASRGVGPPLVSSSLPRSPPVVWEWERRFVRDERTDGGRCQYERNTPGTPLACAIDRAVVVSQATVWRILAERISSLNPTQMHVRSSGRIRCRHSLPKKNRAFCAPRGAEQTGKIEVCWWHGYTSTRQRSLSVGTTCHPKWESILVFGGWGS